MPDTAKNTRVPAAAIALYFKQPEHIQDAPQVPQCGALLVAARCHFAGLRSGPRPWRATAENCKRMQNAASLSQREPVARQGRSTGLGQALEWLKTHERRRAACAQGVRQPATGRRRLRRMPALEGQLLRVLDDRLERQQGLGRRAPPAARRASPRGSAAQGSR